MPKRKADVPQAENDSNDEAAPADSPPPVKPRSRGRPKGSGKPKKVVDPNAPKRSRGRPRINPPKDPDAPKKPRGRPPAEPSTPKKESPVPVKAKVTSSSPGKRGRPAGSKSKPRKRGRKSSSKTAAKQAKPVKQQDEDDETAEQSDE